MRTARGRIVPRKRSAHERRARPCLATGCAGAALRRVGTGTIRTSPRARISMVQTATRRRRLRTPMAVDRPRSRTAASRRACAI